MNYKPSFYKNTLWSILDEMETYRWLFAKNPTKDFTRKSKLGFKKSLSFLLSLGNKSLPNELLEFFNCETSTPSASAFVQCRDKILPDALRFLLYEFNSRCDISISKKYKGYRLLAVDGSDVQIATDPNQTDSYLQSRPDAKGYNLLHLNAMYDFLSHIYTDALIDGKNCANEKRALNRMVDRSDIPSAIVIADRGYESFNCLAHIQEKGWKFLVRVKNGHGGIVSGLNLPDKDTVDELFDLKITRKQTKEIKELKKKTGLYKIIQRDRDFDYLPAKTRKDIPVKPYNLSIRVVRFPISENTVETIITNLPQNEFPLEEIKTLYSMRWGIETSFRKLKYTIGLLYFHAKKKDYVYQEILARMIMYNYTAAIISCIVIENNSRKYAYQANFSTAVHICRHYFHENMSDSDIEQNISRYILPVRPGRKETRNFTPRNATSFLYRVS